MKGGVWNHQTGGDWKKELKHEVRETILNADPWVWARKEGLVSGVLENAGGQSVKGKRLDVGKGKKVHQRSCSRLVCKSGNKKGGDGW